MSGDLLLDNTKCREGFRQGERWAMEAVYRHYSPLVYTVVSKGFGGFRGFFDPIMRDDAVQAVFVTAFEERARLAYDGVGDYAKFLRGLAQNVCRQLLDKDRRFARVPDDDVPGIGASVAQGPSAAQDAETQYLEAEALELCRRFRDALSDPLERSVLDRYYGCGDAEETLAAEFSVTRYRLRKVIAAVGKKMARFQKEQGLP